MQETKFELKEFRIAGILDELSCYCFPYECKFLDLDVSNWKEKLEEFQPQLLFVESAWHGVSNHWYKKVYNISDEILGILNWCRRNNVPTVFWNKEDPVHVDTFLGVASQFDWVYTTDMDCIPLYKRLLGHDRVGVLPFAVCTQKFNPIEKYKRQEKCCFAGGYYALQKERCEDFENIYDVCQEIVGFDIYDRNVYPGNPDYEFPEKYRGDIVGSLPMDKIDIAYKGYQYGITMNTVKYSSTMEARRIFELLACNTISISNPCQAIQNLFGDLVLIYKNDQDLKDRLEQLERVPEYKQKFMLKALRKVMTQHTYAERLYKVIEDVFGETKRRTAKVCAFAVVKTESELTAIRRNFARQNYPADFCIIVPECLKNIECEYTIISETAMTSITELCDAEYYCYFDAHNYYGKNYIVDLIIATQYTVCPVIGKAGYIKRSKETYIIENRNNSYSLVEQVMADRCMVSKLIASKEYNEMSNLTEKIICGYVCTSIDIYNFCENEEAPYCEIADDIEVNEGYSIDEIYNRASSLKEEFYSIQKTFSGYEFVNQLPLNPNKLKMHDFKNGWCGIYSVFETGRLEQKISEDFSVSEYSIDGILRSYVNAKFKGKVDVRIKFCDEAGNIVKTIYNNKGLNLRCQIPENAKTFYYTLFIEEKAVILFKEIVLNAMPKNGIEMSNIGEA